MKPHGKTLALAALALLLAVSSCDVVDRVRNRAAPADTVAVARGSGLVLGLQAPGVLRPGDEGRLRVAVTNRGDTVASGFRLELVVPGWVEPMPPRSGDREVTMGATDDGGTRFAYAMSDAPLPPNGTQTVEQRIRVPASGPLNEGALPWGRTVRARLLSPDGQPLGEVATEMALEGVAAPDTARPHAAADSAGRRDRLGPVRLGMPAAQLRRAVPAARDTAWEQEGTPQQGLVVPISGSASATAMLGGDSVVRVEVHDPAVRTRERLGVGSRVGELREAYGAACVGVAEGTVVIWFANAPGISFALDIAPANAAQIRKSPEKIPASARVTHWWLRRGGDRCKG